MNRRNFLKGVGLAGVAMTAPNLAIAATAAGSHFNTDCYMIGRVTKIDGNYIVCDTIKVAGRGVQTTQRW